MVPAQGWLPPRPSLLRHFPTLAVVGAGACAPAGGHAGSGIAPLSGIYAEPAAAVQRLGYKIVEVDSIIGFVEAVRIWSDGSSSYADQIVVDIYTAAPTGRLTVSIVGQTHRIVESGPGGIAIDQGGVALSTTVRRDVVAVLEALGCAQVESEHRMTLDGPAVTTRCTDDKPAR